MKILRVILVLFTLAVAGMITAPLIERAAPHDLLIIFATIGGFAVFAVLAGGGIAIGLRSAGSLLGIQSADRPNFWCGRRACGHEIDDHPLQRDSTPGRCQQRDCPCPGYLSELYARRYGAI